MYRFMILSLLTVLLTIAFLPGLRAQDGGVSMEEFPGLQGFMQVGNIESSDEHLATETGALGDVPVDGGLSLLLAAGAAYGARRLRRRGTE